MMVFLLSLVAWMHAVIWQAEIEKQHADTGE
jgi:hypothetical protein